MATMRETGASVVDTCERSLRWNDPQLAIAWTLEQLGGTQPLLADKDAAAPSFDAAATAGEVFA